MLQTIREHTQGWIAGTIVGVIILTFALWGVHSYFVEGTGNSIVAEVNGVDITREQLTVAYERLRRQAQIQYGINGRSSSKDEVALKERALRSLIDIQVLKQASFAQGFQISNPQIDAYLQSMPEFQVDGQFSLDRFQEILSSTMLSTSEFLDLIKTSLLIDQPRLGFILTSFALPQEVNYTIQLVNQEREIEYLSIPFQYFLSRVVSVPEDKVKLYYDQHTSDFMTPEQVNVEYVELSLKNLSSTIIPTDAMLKSFYNENINAYTQPMAWKLADLVLPLTPNASPETVIEAKNKADSIVKAIEAGDSFSKLAKPYQKNLQSQNWMVLNEVPPELQKAVASFVKPGQVSSPIKTAYGFVIVQAIDVQQPKIQSFDVVKDKVKETYIRQHAEEKFAEWRDRLADLTYEHSDSLSFASKTLNLPIKTSELFAKEKAGKDISQYKKVRDTAFSNDILNLQNNSDVIQLNPETVIVLRVKSHIVSTLLPLKDIAKQIQDKLKAEQAQRLAEQFAQDLNAKLQKNEDVSKILTAYPFQWNKTGYIGRYYTKVDPAILDTAFSLPQPELVHQTKVYGVARLPNGYAVIALKSVKQGTVADQKQYAIFAQQIQDSQGLLEYELYKQSQTNAAKISIQQ